VHCTNDDVNRRLLALAAIVFGCGTLFSTGVYAAAPGQERIRDKRPSAFKRTAIYGPLAPVRWGLSGFGWLLNKTLLVAEDRGLARGPRGEATSTRKISPVFGGLGDGAGLTGGVAFLRPLSGFELVGSARISLNNYQYINHGVLKPFGRLKTGPEGAFRYQTQQDFYGHGSDSDLAERSTYSATDRTAGWTTFLDLDAIQLRHLVRARSIGISEGTDSLVPTTQSEFDEAEVAGGFGGGHWVSNEV
jgi:hypothetical protein